MAESKNSATWQEDAKNLFEASVQPDVPDVISSILKWGFRVCLFLCLLYFLGVQDWFSWLGWQAAGEIFDVWFFPWSALIMLALLFVTRVGYTVHVVNPEKRCRRVEKGSWIAVGDHWFQASQEGYFYPPKGCEGVFSKCDSRIFLSITLPSFQSLENGPDEVYSFEVCLPLFVKPVPELKDYVVKAFSEKINPLVGALSKEKKKALNDKALLQLERKAFKRLREVFFLLEEMELCTAEGRPFSVEEIIFNAKLAAKFKAEEERLASLHENNNDAP